MPFGIRDNGKTIAYDKQDLLNGELRTFGKAAPEQAKPADLLEIGHGKGCLEIRAGRRGPELRFTYGADALGSKELSQSSFAALQSAATLALGESSVTGQRRVTLEAILTAATAALPKKSDEPNDVL